MPARFSATRLPAPIVSTVRPEVWIERIRAWRLAGTDDDVVADGDRPPASVPVTTVPLPLAAKTRSTQSRGLPRSGATGVRSTSWSSAVRRASRPAPVVDDTGTIGAVSRNVPATRSATSSAASSRWSSSTDVDLRQRDDAVADAEQLEDAQVLLALRLPALRGGDHEQAGVDPADAGEHVPQEPHVARDIDERDRLARRQCRVGEAEVDREPAPLLLCEPVGVGARQREHERRFPVIHVAGSGDDPASTDPHRRARERGDEQDVVGGIDGPEVEERPLRRGPGRRSPGAPT